ncbi:MAG: YceI family protein [Hydrogenophilaceae bacterium]|nr:YceI family protein [Hydrogenophilaceae bacterium]
MKKRIACLLVVASLVPALATAGNWSIDDARSKIGFQYQAMGATLDGEFPQYMADIELDPAKPDQAQITLDVTTAKTDAGNPDATAEVGSPLFFDSRRYPTARFASSRIQPQGNGRFLVEGKLSVKGITRPAGIPVMLKTEGKNQRLTGTFKLNRLDYRIGEGMWADTSALANEVKVAFSLLLVPKPSRKTP